MKANIFFFTLRICRIGSHAAVHMDRCGNLQKTINKMRKCNCENCDGNIDFKSNIYTNFDLLHVIEWPD